MKKDLVGIRFLASDRIDVVPQWQAEVYEKYGVAVLLEHY